MRRQINAPELHQFYLQIGAALWHIQYLEETLVSFIVLKISKERRCAGQAVTMADAQALLDKNRKLTLGPLLDVCMKRKIVPPELQARFAAFKLERHWLVHQSLRENGDDLYEDNARAAVFKRIDALGEEAAALKAIVFGDMTKWTLAQGLSQADVAKRAEEALRTLKGAPPQGRT